MTQKKKLIGRRWKKMADKMAEYANEGFCLTEVADLMEIAHPHPLKRVYTAEYVYSSLIWWKHKYHGELRDGIRWTSKGGKGAFNKSYQTGRTSALPVSSRGTKAATAGMDWTLVWILAAAVAVFVWSVR